MNVCVKFVLAVFFLSSNFAYADRSNVQQMAEDVSFEAPESTLFDSESGQIFVTNVSGDGLTYDGNGWITKLDKQGRLLHKKDLKWAKEGLHAPKGMAILNGILYVADIQYLVLIDVKSGKILKRIFIKDSIILNDVAVSKSNRLVYISDTMGNKIYSFSIDTSKIEIFEQGAHLESPNGLFVDKDELIVAAWGAGIQKDWSTKAKGSLFSIDFKTRKKTLIRPNLGNLDGVVVDQTNPRKIYVSDWVDGSLYVVEGNKTTKLGGFSGAADIGIIFTNDGVDILLPSMASNQIFKINFKK